MALEKLEITNKQLFASGQTFGDVGTYHQIDGIAHFAVDPAHQRNDIITDLNLGPIDANGKVRFTSDFSMLQPTDKQSGNHRILFDVVNRGGRTVISNFNNIERPSDPTAPLQAGNGFLMREGYTVVWSGWQADVPETPGLIGLRAPDATLSNGEELTGRILCQFQVNESSQVHYLADRNHLPHPPVDPDDPEATLLVLDHPNDQGETVSRDKWSFVRVEDPQIEPEPCHVYMPEGFEPGRIYQLIFNSKGSKLVGLGFAAVRDTVSFLKYETELDRNPCAGDIEYAYAFGISQSGRFLREMIYLGLNIDEQERMSLDGIIPHVGGAMRGEFNLRFGQPSKDVCFIIPELFPFTDTDQSDPVTGKSGSLFSRLEESGQTPKVMFSNTAAEYWRGDAALIHTNLETLEDAAEAPGVRRYMLAGCQHGSGAFPPVIVRPNDGIRGQLPFNSIDYTPLLRAMLTNLDRWVTSGEEPPASAHPSINKGTAVESSSLVAKFTALPGVQPPKRTTNAMRLDYGPEAHLGRTTILPPIQGEHYPAYVSDINEDFNEISGLRLPDLMVPVASYTGWNLRHPSIGNEDLVIGITGGLAGWTLGLPSTKEARINSNDPRLSIEERYASRDEYLQQFQQAIDLLIEERIILADDSQDLLQRAQEKYDYFTN